MRLLAGISFIILSNYFAILAPQLTGYVVDRVQLLLPGASPRPMARQTDPLVHGLITWMESLNWSFGGIVTLCGITILLLAIVRGIFMFFMRQTIIVMSRHIEFDQKNEVYKHYQTLDAHFYKMHSVGDLMNRIAEDVSRVRMYTGPAIMYLINLCTILFFALYHMFGKSVSLTLYSLAPIPVLAILIYQVNNIIHKRSEKIQGLLSDLTVQAQQNYSGIRVIKSYGLEAQMLRQFEKNSKWYRRQAIDLAGVDAFYYPTIQLLIGISTLTTIFIGGLHYINGSIAEVGTIVEFILYITMLTFPVSAIGWVASMIQRAAASQKRLNEFLETEPAIKDGAIEKAPQAAVGIEFKNVSFTYEHTGIEAIKNLDLHIAPGKKVAIVGKTGSGKSTMGALLLRLFDATKGTVLVNGHPVSDYTLAALRQQISYVPQDVFLFSETVANNIRFGHPQASMEEVKKAAAMASIAHEIEGFADQYNTLVGERGVTLSGGQKQRISIARALLKPCSIIILDDCLSAVDASTEQEVLKNLAEVLANKTTLVITHRIFNLLQFDHIIVLDEGAIAEQGTHESLMQRNGLYAAMYQRQQLQEHQGAA